ncbi:MAG: hypothetical protein ABIV06_05810 [Thermoanaerobaculia bacterium]
MPKIAVAAGFARRARRASIALIGLIGLLQAGSLAAYTVHLKDGTSIVAKKKYVVQGDKAILVLPSGAETALALAEIDVAKTDAANLEDIGTAIVIENGKATDLTRGAPAPSGKQTLKELLQKRAAAEGSNNAGAVVLDAGPSHAATDRQPTSHAGQAPLRDSALSTEIRTFIFGRGITSLEVQQGSKSTRPRLVFETSSETQVFRALQVSAGALIEAREKFPGQLESFEVICDGPAGGRGGHFTLTPPQAADLISGRIDLPTFFIQNVEF